MIKSTSPLFDSRNDAALHVIKLTSNTNTRTLRLCVRFKYTLHFIAVSNRFSRCLDHCFRLFSSLFESIWIDYKTQQQWSYFVFETFYQFCCFFLASMSRPQSPLIRSWRHLQNMQMKWNTMACNVKIQYMNVCMYNSD